MKKRILGLLLTAVLMCGVIGAFPVFAHVTDVPQFCTAIYTADDLKSINNNLNGNYILMNDIDLSSYGNWTPIGTGFEGAGFTGIFDGNGYAVKHMNICDDSVLKGRYGYKYAGLFATVKGATIKNIRYISGLINCEKCPSLKAGAVAASSYGSTISRCASYVNISYKYGEPTRKNVVTGTSGISFRGGGIVGHVQSDDLHKCTTISKCSNHALIEGISDCATMDIGGILGDAFAGELIISDCYNIASLQSDTDNNSSNIGGILGNSSASGTVHISNCYNTGKYFKCNVGKNDEIVSHSNIGGIAGCVGGWQDATTIKKCYYIDEQQNSVGSIIGSLNHTVITANMCNDVALRSQSTYSGFDFNKVWQMGTGSNPYPVLRWENEENSTTSIAPITSNSTPTPSQSKPCQTHKYTSASGDVCTVCGHVFDYALVEYDKTLYAAANNIAVRDKPYAKAGKLVKKLAKGTKVNVKYYFNNSLGSKWYMTDDGSYIYSERLTSQSPNEITLRFDANAPTFSNKPIRQKSTTGTFRIPTDSIPERNGYNFKGWSTSKNATIATYNSGSSFCTNKDTTLYAVWEEKEIHYRDDIEKVLRSIVNGTSEYSKIGDSGKKYWSWYYNNNSNRLDSWCAIYVTYILNLVNVDWDTSVSCVKTNQTAQINCLKKYNCYHSGNSGYVPKTGDLAFFKWDGAKGPGHVGIVVVDDNGKINYLHGNYHDSDYTSGTIPNTVVCYSDKCTVNPRSHSQYLTNHIYGYGDMESYTKARSK